jgi:serine/threonine protein kinase
VNVAKSTTAALDYLHSHGIAHGDVYAHNMLAAKDGTTVLCDYGASFFYPIEQRALWEPVEVLFSPS